MALRHTLVTPHNITVPNAYTRGENYAMVVKGVLTFDAVAYNIDPAVNPLLIVQERHSLSVDVNAPLHAQVYDYLKSLPQYAGAVDC